MSKDKDSQLIWEQYDSPGRFSGGAIPFPDGRGEHVEPQSNKFRGPGSPGVNLAKGYLLQALELIEDDDVHLCADAEALKTTVNACKKAIEALTHDSHEVQEANTNKQKGKYDDGDDKDEKCDHVPCHDDSK